MKFYIAAPVFLLAASLGLAACSNGQNAPNDQTAPNDTQSAQMAPANNPGAMDSNNPGAMDSNQPGSDTWITTKVKTELATTDGVTSTDISVKTVNGVVTLTGVQPSDIAVQKAVAAAKSIKGVKQVDSSGLKSNG